MSKKLYEIANIASGATFRKKIEINNLNGFNVIQAGDIVDIIITHIEPLSQSENIFRDPYVLQKNDILITARGMKSFKVGLFAIESEQKYIASSSVHIIRINDPNVHPRYLLYFLSSEMGQKEIQKITSGSSIQTLLIKNLMELMIPIPPIQIQKSIIALHENMQAQEKIQERKNELKKIIINATFINLTKTEL